ncbi:hypothetical protein K8R30_04820 [archaeon]|nr:hypothetical protein [archaeon]
MQIQNTSNLNGFFNECNHKVSLGKTIHAITLLFDDKSRKVEEIFAEKGFDIKRDRKIIELKTKYIIHKDEKEVYYYLIQHETLKEVYYIFTMNSVGDIYRTLFGTIESNDEIYFLWLPPKYFDEMKEKILENENAYMTSFRCRTMGRENVGKRPMFAKEITYKGDDAKSALEEFRFEYGVFPQAISFVIPSEFEFKVNCKGYYSLSSGDVIDFKKKIIEEFIGMIMKDNKKIESAKLAVEKVEGKEKIVIKEIVFRLEKELSFEEMSEFKDSLEKENFSLYSEKLEEGSVVFSSHIVDETKGNIFTITSNGKDFTVVPKYGSGFSSLVRFHRFLVEKIDQSTKILEGNDVLVAA